MGCTPRSAYAPLRGGKGEVFEGGIRNISLLHWPQKIKGGQKLEQVTIKNMLFDIREDPNEYRDVAAQHPDRVKAMAEQVRVWRSQYIVSGTRANLMPPPGWRAPLDWVNYPTPVAELQDEAAPGMLKGKSRILMQRSLGDRGRLIYD